MRPEEREKKEQLLALMLEEKNNRDINRLKAYKPHAGFQEAFFKSNASVRLVTAGNQSGKTHSAAVEAAMYALGIHPYKKIRVPNVGLIVSGQAFKTGIEQIIVPKLKQVTGINDIVEIKNNSQGNPVKIIWSNNSITHLMSAEQDIEAFEGTTTGWAWVDEPISREIFIAIKRGMLTTGGHFWMTCTPLSEPWIYEDLYLAGISKADPNIECFVGSSDENIHISDEAKIEFKKHLTEDEIDIRWYGKFRHLTGRVFKSYKPEIHKIPAFDIPPHWPVYVAIDPHKQKPHAVIFLAVAPNNNKYICNEIYVKCGITQLAEHILDIGSQYNIVKRLIDSSASELDFERRETAKSMLSKAGVQTQVARKANLKNTGIMLINELFQKDELFVFEHCTRTHRELQNQIFQQNKRDPSVLMEEPQKKFDDATDCIRYILVERPTYRDNARIKMQEAPYVRKYV